MHFSKPLSFLLLAVSMAACSLLPSTQVPTLGGQGPQIPIQLANDPSPSLIPEPEMVKFPPLVTTTPLARPAPESAAAVDEAIKELVGKVPSASRPSGGGPSWGPSGSSTQQGIHVLSFSAEGGSQQIQMPASGSFRLIVQAGRHFEILDSEARDGEARIQLPAGQFETLIKVQGGTLQLEDRLYYVKDTLQDYEWHMLGIRPLPVPAAWYEPDGQLVLHFNTNQTTGFQLSWRQQSSPAPMPPGLQEVGPAGGTVELPGVSTLEIPAGALSQPTLVRLRQLEEAPAMINLPPPLENSLMSLCFHSDDCTPGGAHYISPVVRVDPVGLELLKPAYIQIVSETEAYYAQQHTGGVFQYLRATELTPMAYYFNVANINHIIHTSQNPDFYPTDPIPLLRFGFSAKMIVDGFYLDDEEVKRRMFNTQSSADYSCSAGMQDFGIVLSSNSKKIISTHFQIDLDDDLLNSLNDDARCKIAIFFEKAREELLSQGLTLGPHLQYKKTIIRLKPYLGNDTLGIVKIQCEENLCEPFSEIAVCPELLEGAGQCVFNEAKFLGIAAHEMLHVFQLGHQDKNYPVNRAVLNSERWLREGSAVWFGAWFGERHHQRFGVAGYDLAEDINVRQISKNVSAALHTPVLLADITTAYGYGSLFRLLSQTDAAVVFRANKDYVENQFTVQKAHDFHRSLNAVTHALGDGASLARKTNNLNRGGLV